MTGRTKPSDYIHNHFDKICEYEEIGRPMTPSWWDEGGVTYTPVTELEMTCGGGMGGAHWSEFIERIGLNELSTKDVIVVKKWNGEQIMINMQYVVTAKQRTIASAVLHSKNPNYPQGKHTYNWLVRDGHEITLTN